MSVWLNDLFPLSTGLRCTAAAWTRGLCVRCVCSAPGVVSPPSFVLSGL